MRMQKKYDFSKTTEFSVKNSRSAIRSHRLAQCSYIYSIQMYATSVKLSPNGTLASRTEQPVFQCIYLGSSCQLTAFVGVLLLFIPLAWVARRIFTELIYHTHKQPEVIDLLLCPLSFSVYYLFLFFSSAVFV